MRSWKEVYQRWHSFEQLDEQVQLELRKINDTSLLEDAFYKELTFGTGGIRGVLGPGTNRMNVYTVRKVVEGLANYLPYHRVNVKDRGVVIAYDSRYMSKEFALEAARVLSVHGIKAYVFESLRPTPLLSFAVRYLGAACGIMITASHNPPEYNGLKVYNEDGGQITPTESDQIVAAINEIEDELTVPFLNDEELAESGLLHWIGKEIDNAYLERINYISRMDPAKRMQDKDLQIVFTPLHGTSYDLVTSALEQMRFLNVHVVTEQAIPDPDFSTVESPNPEEHQAFALAEELGDKVDADILLGTDPDADRLGVAVKNGYGEFQVLTGNQLGSLLLDYILRHSNPNVYKNAKMIKTVVTTELGRAIADSYHVETLETLTGFKYIGEKIHQFDASGETFIFGFEESYGYLVSGFVRDKDAIQAAIITAEMAYYWKQRGKTLFDALHDLYETHGFYLEGMSSLTLKGKEGAKQISFIMSEIRNMELTNVAGFKMKAVEDYLTSEKLNLEDNSKAPIDLPKENMVKLMLDEKAWVCLRPSGTEPKLKTYYGVCGKNRKDSEEKLAKLKEAMANIMDKIMTVKA
ncbi:phospho-sugar mutase [Oceanobacillus bengalensis]|uniref:phosphoglucomutase (alpha-D-glucose-1,6-bisphosphate-dependent) n=1 Tax=Oceanobacillus bengalensis TaxID=1435466 RepID=A0A494Z089_9BACI|nr:phospho-sugar mutase [Oceanobacillus bengalensis]RKQ15905.1 phospho-sugar mutase [Oceanobacillus bengalensis]